MLPTAKKDAPYPSIYNRGKKQPSVSCRFDLSHQESIIVFAQFNIKSDHLYKK